MARNDDWASAIGGLLSGFSGAYFPMLEKRNERDFRQQQYDLQRRQQDLLDEARREQMADSRFQRQFQRDQAMAKTTDDYNAQLRQWERDMQLGGPEIAGPKPQPPSLLQGYGLMGGQSGAAPGGSPGMSPTSPMQGRPMYGPTSDAGGAPVSPASAPASSGNKTYANLGDYIFNYESGNDPSNVSPDAGGFSYGVNQTNHSPARGNTSAIPKFISQYGYTPWFTDAPGTPTFNKQWQSYGQSNPDFAAAQRDFAQKEFFAPVAEYAASKGIDTSNKGIQEALLGIGNAHGPETAKRIIDRVAAANPGGTSNPVQFLGALYAERMKPGDGGALAYWKSSSPEVQASVKNRLATERNDVLGLAQAGSSPAGSRVSITAPSAADQQILDIANGEQAPARAGFTPPPWSQGTNIAQAGQPTVTDVGKQPAQQSVQTGPKDLRWWVNNATDADLAKLSIVRPDLTKTILELRKRNEPPNDIKEYNAYAGMTPEQKQQFAEYKRLSKPETTIDMRQDTAEGQAYGKALVDEYNAVREKGVAAEDELNAILGAKNVMPTQTDTFAPMKAAAGALAYSMGVDPQKLNLPDPSNAQAFSGAVGNMILGKATSMKGNLSDKDISFLKASVPTLSNTPQANAIMLDIAEKMARRKMEKVDFYNNYRDANGTFNGATKAWGKHITDNPLFSQSERKEQAPHGPKTAPANGVPPEGSTVRDKNGKLYKVVNGQPVPLE